MLIGRIGPVRSLAEDYLKNKDYLESVIKDGSKKGLEETSRRIDEIQKILDI